MNEGDSPTTSQFQKGGVVKNEEVAKTAELALIADAICQPEGYKIFLTELTEAQRI